MGEVGALSTMHHKINMVVLTTAKTIVVIGMVTTATHSPCHLQDGSRLLQEWLLSETDRSHLHLGTLLDNLIKLRIIQLLLMAMIANLEGRTGIMAKLINIEMEILTEDNVAMNIEAVVTPTKGTITIVERG